MSVWLMSVLTGLPVGGLIGGFLGDLVSMRFVMLLYGSLLAASGWSPQSAPTGSPASTSVRADPSCRRRQRRGQPAEYGRRWMGESNRAPGTRLSRRDRFLHEPRYRDWNWVETNWFCFFVPAEKMVGHLRSIWRPTLGIVGANVFVYSNRGLDALGRWPTTCTRDRFAMPMPPHNLDDYRLDNGIAVRQTEAFGRWEVRYDGIDGTVFDWSTPR